MEAYHGTSAGIFDSFSLGHALEGDGKVKFGWGVYVTEKYGTAAHYAFNKHRPENKEFYVYTVSIPDRTDDNCLSLLARAFQPGLDLLLRMKVFFSGICDAVGANPASPAKPGRIDKRKPIWTPFMDDMKRSGPLTLLP